MYSCFTKEGIEKTIKKRNRYKNDTCAREDETPLLRIAHGQERHRISHANVTPSFRTAEATFVDPLGRSRSDLLLLGAAVLVDGQTYVTVSHHGNRKHVGVKMLVHLGLHVSPSCSRGRVLASQL